MTFTGGRGKDTITVSEYEERKREEEKNLREDDHHEISNRALKLYREHRRVHHGEEFVEDGRVLAANGKTIKARKRVESEERLYRALGEARVNAMAIIRVMYSIMANGLGMQTFDPLKARGKSLKSNSGPELVDFYFQWGRAVQKARHDHSMCIDTAVFGVLPYYVDRDKRQRNGTAQRNLEACLDIALQMGILKLMREEG